MITVCRKNVLSDLVNAVLVQNFNFNAKLRIKFLNEDADDASGLTREALRIAVNEIVTKHGMFLDGMLINKETYKCLNSFN